MTAHISVTPIKPGATADWQEFVTLLRGPRRVEWAESQRRRGIRREVVSLSSGSSDLAVVYTECDEHARAAELLSGSDHEFDRWYRERMATLLDAPFSSQVVFDSAPKPGPWRGLRLFRGPR